MRQQDAVDVVAPAAAGDECRGPDAAETAKSERGGQLSLATELRKVAAKIDQGATPVLAQRLCRYHDALRTAQAVIAAFQELRIEEPAEQSSEEEG